MNESAHVVRVGRDHHNDHFRRIVEDTLNQGRLEVSAEIFGPSFVDRGHGGAAKRDRAEGWAECVKPVSQPPSDLKATIQSRVAGGDYLAMWNAATATQEGEL